MFQENKYPLSKVDFCCSPYLGYFVSMWIYEVACIHICMYDTCFSYCCLNKSAWIFLWHFGFGFWATYFASFNQRLLLQPRVSLPAVVFAFFSNQSSNEMFFSFQSVLKGFCTYQPCLLPSSLQVHLAQPLSVGLIFWFPCFNFVADVVQSHGAVFMESASLSTPISAPQFRGFRRASEISIASQVSGMADSYTASNIANSKCFTPLRLPLAAALLSQHYALGESHTASVCLSGVILSINNKKLELFCLRPVLL